MLASVVNQLYKITHQANGTLIEIWEFRNLTKENLWGLFLPLTPMMSCKPYVGGMRNHLKISQISRITVKYANFYTFKWEVFTQEVGF